MNELETRICECCHDIEERSIHELSGEEVQFSRCERCGNDICPDCYEICRECEKICCHDCMVIDKYSDVVCESCMTW